VGTSIGLFFLTKKINSKLISPKVEAKGLPACTLSALRPGNQFHLLIRGIQLSQLPDEQNEMLNQIFSGQSF
jgi:hypothetical protein